MKPARKPDLRSFDNTFAHAEGWALFNDGELQALDEGCIVNGAPTGRIPFDSDEEALAHVQRLAEAGSGYHKQALALVAQWSAPMRCPFCKSRSLHRELVKWEAQTRHTLGVNENTMTEPLDEHQCDNCGRSFWT